MLHHTFDKQHSHYVYVHNPFSDWKINEKPDTLTDINQNDQTLLVVNPLGNYLGMVMAKCNKALVLQKTGEKQNVVQLHMPKHTRLAL